MARLTQSFWLCVALCCTSALAARELRQTSTGADGPSANLASLLAAVPPSNFVTLIPFAPAPGPGALAPEIAPLGAEIGAAQAPAAAPAKASGKTYVPTSDPACLYPTSGDCSSLQSTYPSAKACPQATTTSIQNAAKQGKFNSAIASNQASAPPLFGSSIFGNSPSTSGSNSIFGNSGGLSFPSFPGFPGTG
ncbi:hypothetical protein WJX73_000340 [Symbiochloris irregularis]|uniref:Uncharacterized protein n=1 Tax=Symbiochloris irregularis TaxID=706552 RepID=A0AAW1PRS3_9CHLO